MCNCKQDKELADDYPFMTVDDMPDPLPVPQRPPREQIEWVEETGPERTEIEVVEPTPERLAELAQRDALLQKLRDQEHGINRADNFPPSGKPV